MREEFLAALAHRLKGRVKKAYTFGSFDSSDFMPWSDVDLLLVAESERPRVERFMDFLDVLDLAREIDLIVLTPGEFDMLSANTPAGFWRSVFNSLKPVH